MTRRGSVAAAAAQIGRPLTAVTVRSTVNLVAPGELYGERVRQLDISAKKIIRFGGQRLTVGVDIYNLANNNVTLAFNQAFVADHDGLADADDVHEPARLPPERRVRLVVTRCRAGL